MSRRPRGPSDRPHFWLEDDLEAAEAPRLQGQSLMSKVMVALLTLCCCSLLALVVLFATSVWAQLPPMASATATAVGPGAAVVAIEHRGGVQRQHMQRSVLRRLAMLRRAQPPQKGVDQSSVQLAFPHWLTGAGDYDLQATLPDIILALSYLAQEDDAYRG